MDSGHHKIEAIETNTGGVERVGLTGIDQRDLRQVPAVFVDGKEPELGLTDQGDVVAGRSGGGDKSDENRSGTGDRQGRSAGQCAAWEQFRQRHGHRQGFQGSRAHRDTQGSFIAFGRGGCQFQKTTALFQKWTAQATSRDR